MSFTRSIHEVGSSIANGTSIVIDGISKIAENTNIADKCLKFLRPVIKLIQMAVPAPVAASLGLINELFGNATKIFGAGNIFNRAAEWVSPNKATGKYMWESWSVQKIASRAFLTGAHLIEHVSFWESFGLYSLGSFSNTTANVAFLGAAKFSPLGLVKNLCVIVSASFGISSTVKDMKGIDEKIALAGNKIEKWKNVRQVILDKEQPVVDELVGKYAQKQMAIAEKLAKEEISFAKKSEEVEIQRAALMDKKLSDTDRDAKINDLYKKSLYGQQCKIEAMKDKIRRYGSYQEELKAGQSEGELTRNVVNKVEGWSSIHDVRKENESAQKRRSWIAIATDITKIAIVSLVVAITFPLCPPVGFMMGLAGFALAHLVVELAAGACGFLKEMNEVYHKSLLINEPQKPSLFKPTAFKAVM